LDSLKQYFFTATTSVCCWVEEPDDWLIVIEEHFKLPDSYVMRCPERANEKHDERGGHDCALDKK
jgi:hypothetical protein